jgi:hypothetical protein
MGLLIRPGARIHGVFAVATLLLALGFWPLTSGPVLAAAQPIVVVVKASFQVKDIDLATLRRVFSGQATDLGGKRLIPINHPNGTPQRVAFDKQVLGLEAADVGKFWIAKRIRDEGSPPKTVPSAELAVRIAASLAGAVTYALPAQVNASVRVLTVNGKAAGQPQYPLSL